MMYRQRIICRFFFSFFFFFLFLLFSFFPRYFIVRAQLVDSGGQPSVTFLIEERPKEKLCKDEKKKFVYIYISLYIYMSLRHFSN